MEDKKEIDPKDLAQADYIRGMKFKDIASKYNVSVNTIKSWKLRYNWVRKDKPPEIIDNAPLKEKVAPQVKKSASKKTKGAKKVQSNASTLSDKQMLFCIYYVKYRNKTKAYQKAYQCSYSVACSNAYYIYQVEAVQKEIARQLEELRQELVIDTKDIIQKYIDIAFSDITDYLEITKKEVQVGEGAKKKTIIVNDVILNPSKDIDGSLISEVKEGKDGISIKLHDKMKALEWLAERFDILPVATKERIDIEKQKLNIAQEKHDKEIEKLNGSTSNGNLDQLTEIIKKSAELFGGK